jgi:two-component system phosphate regulon sensor histidine kinase PhoR
MRAVQKDLALARQQAAFVSAVSHEFRSPLTSLAHLTSLLRSDFQPSEERRRQYYEVLAHESERLRRFVETLLDFGRMQAGATRYHLEAVDAGAIVSGIVEEFRRHAAAGAHPVSLVTADLTARIAADREALGRAIWNLLENAAKYSPAEKPIIVRLEENEGRVTIRVSDQGPGIPAAEQPFIFDQFYRGAAAIESAVKGTGVGLAMVRHIVRGHQGEVQVDSEPGSGSTFSIVLPPAPPESTAMPERRIS